MPPYLLFVSEAHAGQRWGFDVMTYKRKHGNGFWNVSTLQPKMIVSDLPRLRMCVDTQPKWQKAFKDTLKIVSMWMGSKVLRPQNFSDLPTIFYIFLEWKEGLFHCHFRTEIFVLSLSLFVTKSTACYVSLSFIKTTKAIEKKKNSDIFLRNLTFNLRRLKSCLNYKEHDFVTKWVE